MENKQSLIESVSYFDYKNVVLSFVVADFLFKSYLNLRQLNNTKSGNINVLLKDHLQQTTFEKSKSYSSEKLKLALFRGLYDFVQTIAMLKLNVYLLLWQFCDSITNPIVNRISFFDYQITNSVIFLGAFVLIQTILDLPLSFYGTFKIEQKYGFNKQTYKLFLVDVLKGTFLKGLFGIPILSIFLYIIKKTGDKFYLYVWVFMVFVQLFLMSIFPTFIQPLFNKFTPLQDGELKSKIEALCKKVGFPLTNVFVIDGSTRSSHSNAYFFGLFKNKRIVLYDTLLNQCSNDQIIAILAHEIGHWSCSHIYKMMIIIQMYMFSQFALFSKFISNTSLYNSFGFKQNHIIIGFILYQHLLAPIDFVLTFWMNSRSRKHEFEADKYSKDMGYSNDLQKALINIHVENLSEFNPDYLYSTYHYSHPPLVERLAAISKS